MEIALGVLFFPLFFFFFPCLCLSSAHGGVEKLNKPRLPRNGQSEGRRNRDWAFLPCRDILYLDAYSTKGKNRLLLARSLRRLISSLSGRGKIYGGCLVSFLFRFDRKREREKIEDFRRWFHIFIIVSFRGKYNLQLQSAITKCIFRIFILIL